MVWLGLCLAYPTTPITNFDHSNYPKPPFHPHSVVDPSAFHIFSCDLYFNRSDRIYVLQVDLLFSWMQVLLWQGTKSESSMTSPESRRGKPQTGRGLIRRAKLTKLLMSWKILSFKSFILILLHVLWTEIPLFIIQCKSNYISFVRRHLWNYLERKGSS